MGKCALVFHEVKRIVEDHMLNPDEFFSRIAISQVYLMIIPNNDPEGYWAWSHLATRGVLDDSDALENRLSREAELYGRSITGVITETPWFHENYASATAKAGMQEIASAFRNTTGARDSD